MNEIETLTEEERQLADEAISEVENSERALSGTDVGRPENATALRKMQHAYTSLVVERLGLQAKHTSLAVERLGFQAKHAKARQRITELEAQVTASETVSRAEYDAMVKQRDTLRQERNTAINERDTERIRVNALCEALEVAREALRDAMGDIGDALGLSEEEPQ